MIHILMSTYNGGQYLNEQLDSIIAQDYTDWHLFIRDDGSTDNTRQIIMDYAATDNRISLVDNENQNLGAMMSFVYLMEHYSDAEYFAFADQDDVWKPEKLSTCIQAMHNAENTFGKQIPIIVHSDLEVVDDNLHCLSPSFWKYVNINTDILDDNIHYLAICNSITGCASLFNRKVIDVSLPMNHVPYMHDIWIGLCTLKHNGKLIAINKPLIYYRQHGDNVCGAQEYSFKLFNIKEKWQLAKRSYQTAHPIVFRNIPHFILWKTIYFFKLHFRR